MTDTHTTRLSINLSTGSIEAEGSEEFVSAVYEDFRDNLEAYQPRAATKVKPMPFKRPHIMPKPTGLPKRPEMKDAVADAKKKAAAAKAAAAKAAAEKKRAAAKKAAAAAKEKV